MSNETQWTPGPWTALDDGYQHRIIYGELDLAILDPDGEMADADNAANARLIVAAPEMAALLERNQNVIMDALTSGHGITPAIADDMRAVLAEARALLAKIKKGA